MSFWDHLEVLRWMLIRVLAVWTVCMLLGFVFVPYLFEQVVMAPCRDDFFLYQLIKQTAARSWIVPDFMETSFLTVFYSHDSVLLAGFVGYIPLSRV